MRPVRRFRRALVAALLTAAVVPAAASADTSAAAAAACPGSNQVPTVATISQARDSVLCLLNHYRAAHGLRALRSDHSLRTAAKRFSIAMRQRRFFDHTSPSGSTPLQRIRATGYLRHASSFQVGENIGWGGGDLGTPASMADAWMHSAGHRFNILHASFRDIGIGIAVGDPAGGDGITYTTDFGVRS